MLGTMSKASRSLSEKRIVGVEEEDLNQLGTESPPH